MTLPTVSGIDVRWLTDPTLISELTLIPPTQALQRMDYPIPPEIGHGWLERLPLTSASSLYRGVHRFRPGNTGQLIPLAEFHLTFAEPTLVIQTIQGGIVCHQEFYPQAELIYKPGYDFFRRADRLQMIPLVDTSSDSEMTALILTEAGLVEWIGEELTEKLMTRLGLAPPPIVKVLPVPMMVSAPLRASLSTQLQGPLQKLFAQSKALEYLCALLTHTATLESPARRKRDQLQELRGYLMHLEGKLPALDELAVRFGLSARRLNDAFTQEYGLPIYAFMADWRLNEAHVAILDSDIPLKSLAMRLGYSHVNHFNNAFKKKFGYPPGQLRKDRRAEEVEL